MEIVIEILKWCGIVFLAGLAFIFIAMMFYAMSFLQMKAWMKAFFDKEEKKKTDYAETFKN